MTKLQDLDDVEGKPGQSTHNYAYVWDSVKQKFALSKVITSLQSVLRAIEAVRIALATHNHSDANENTFVGNDSFTSNVDGFGNVAVGENTLELNEGGDNNTAVGWYALSVNVSGNDSTGVGSEALRDNLGSSNTGIGAGALREITTGSGNVGIGSSTLSGVTTNSSNLAMGASAGAGANADGCVYLGTNAGIANATDNKLFIANNASLALIEGTMDAVATNQELIVNADSVLLPSIPTASSAGVWVESTVLRYGASADSFAEKAQDAVGTILTDTTTIDFTYTDATPTITADVINDSISNTKLANMAETTVKGRAVGAGTGDPTDLTAAQLIAIIATADGAGSGLDADLLDGNSSAAFALAVHTHTSAAITDFTEAAQDAVGGAFVDTATVSLTYNDGIDEITADVLDDSITDAKIRNSNALSVIGRDANTTGNPGDISAVAASGSVLRESGSTIGFGTIATAGITNDAVTDTKIRNSGALSVIGRSANSSGDPADISATAATDAVLRESGNTLGFGTIATAGITNDAVTNTKLANMTETTVKGRAVGAGTGDPTDLTAAQLNTIVGSTTLTMADGIRIDTDEVRARDSGGLNLKDDGGNLGVFIEDGGLVGIGNSNPAVALDVAGDATIGAGSGATVASINGAAASVRDIRFQTAGSNRWIVRTDGTAEGGSNAGSDFQILRRADDGTAIATPLVIMRATGYTGVNDVSPDGMLDVNQSSTTAAVPTLELEQADLSEEFINFVGTIGAGNSIEADTTPPAAPSHKIRIATNGTFRYIYVYDS